MPVKRSITTVTLILVLLFSLSLSVQSVNANPVFVPPITVNSPENNVVYSTNEIPLSFAFTHAYHNYSGFSYSLDGNELIDTNQSSTLKILSSGSHVLAIYGNSSSEKYGSNHALLDIVYFSAVYSTAWLLYGLVMTVFVLALALLVYFGRMRLINRLKAKKKLSFWLGLLSFLFFTFVVFIPFFWDWSQNYLFPKFPSELEISPVFYIATSIPFMFMGMFLMWFGTRKGEGFESKIKRILGDKQTKGVRGL
jgi:hypothetical protein